MADVTPTRLLNIIPTSSNLQHTGRIFVRQLASPLAENHDASRMELASICIADFCYD